MDKNCIGRNHLENSITEIEKTVKIEVKLPHVNKNQNQKRIFVQTRFSHSTLEWINSPPKKH